MATAKLTFDDEFNTLSIGNTSSSNWRTGFFYDPTHDNNGDWVGTTPAGWSPYAIDNGVLDMTIRFTPAADAASVGGAKFESGMLNTFESFSQTYGYFEMRAQNPGGTGIQPAFWLLPASGAWPPELDVFEGEGSAPNLMVSTAWTALGGGNADSVWADVASMTTGFHTYGVDWEPDKITFYFDNKAVNSVPTPSDLNKPMYMLATLTADGWNGNTDSTTPQSNTWQIDYVRAWSSMPTAAQEAAVPTGTLLPAPPAPAAPVLPAPPVATPPVVLLPVPPTSITIARSMQSYTTTIDNQSLLAYSGNHTFFLNGSNDVLNASGGREFVVVGGTGARIVLPAAGDGSDTIMGDVFHLGTTFDLSAALDETRWDGSASTLSRFLKVAADGNDLRIQVADGGRHGSSRPTTIATLVGQGAHSYADVVARAVL